MRQMKKLSFLLFSGLIFCYTVSSQVANSGNKFVEQTVIDLFQGFSELSLEKIKNHCTSDFLLFENGAVWNADSLAPGINRRKNSPDFRRINKFDFIKTEVRGKTAWTSYYNKADITSSGKTFSVRWLESAILVKEKKNWKIKFLHSTELERINQ
jgi:hypothetical protein